MDLVLFTIAVVLGLMVAETRLSRDHEKRLMANGAIAPEGDVYPVMAVLYPASFLSMGVEGAWRASRAASVVGLGPWALDEKAAAWFASGLLMFIAAKALKYWAIRSLGERWSFRVLIVPGAPLVTDGPYRYVAHPNYIALGGELAGTAMMMNARVSGPVMIALFGAALWARVRFETRMLRKYAG